jgi:hypothetical protein
MLRHDIVFVVVIIMFIGIGISSVKDVLAKALVAGGVYIVDQVLEVMGCALVLFTVTTGVDLLAQIKLPARLW